MIIDINSTDVPSAMTEYRHKTGRHGIYDEEWLRSERNKAANKRAVHELRKRISYILITCDRHTTDPKEISELMIDLLRFGVPPKDLPSAYVEGGAQYACSHLHKCGYAVVPDFGEYDIKNSDGVSVGILSSWYRYHENATVMISPFVHLSGFVFFEAHTPENGFKELYMRPIEC